jgi:hypothetical protein
MSFVIDQTKAPATVAVRDHPMRELMEARAKMEQWGEQVRLIKELLELPEVSAADKMTLSLELMTAKSCLLACANIITACEERMRQQARRLEQRWGWLL